jgi:TM2 domain-containing membrane protein YozV
MGLGQIYNGQIGKGILFMIVYLVSILLIFAYIGFITTPLFWILGMTDAYYSAISVNKELARRA